VVFKALVIAYAVHETGLRSGIGLDVGEVESDSFWTEFLRGLKKRGLRGVRLAISDDHEGLKAAVARAPCQWQRCTVHLSETCSTTAAATSATSSPPRSERCSTPQAAGIGHVIARLEPIAPKVCRLLEDAEEDLIAFYLLPSEQWTKLHSTNPLERVNKEIGRRTDVVVIFPDDASVIRLAGEQNDEWLVQRRFLSAESMQLILSAGWSDEDSLEQQPEGGR
jgi:putative transposase